MKRLVSFFFVLIILEGCVEMSMNDIGHVGYDPVVPLPESGQVAAIGHQERQDYIKAFRYWKDAERVVRDQLSAISKQLEILSEQHSEKGREHFKEKNGDAAFHEFMVALRFNPANRTASNYLSKRFRPTRSTYYKIKKGDTFASIADSLYGSSDYEFAVALFSSAKTTSELIEGETITLAALDSFTSDPINDYPKDIEIARGLFKTGRYEDVLPVAEALRENHPQDSEISYIINKSLLKLAEIREDEGRYDEAVHTLFRIDPRFKNVEGLIEKLEEKLDKQPVADTFEVNSRLLRKGTERSAQGNHLEAVEILLLVDPGFEGREAALSDVRRELKKQAESYYEEGVMLLNEKDLAGALSQWEKALQCDPAHSDVLQAIEKARRQQREEIP